LFADCPVVEQGTDADGVVCCASEPFPESEECPDNICGLSSVYDLNNGDVGPSEVSEDMQSTSRGIGRDEDIGPRMGCDRQESESEPETVGRLNFGVSERLGALTFFGAELGFGPLTYFGIRFKVKDLSSARGLVYGCACTRPAYDMGNGAE
jgi:hypothetical protein